MRTIEKINQDIERCQGQIAAIYDMPEHEQCPISLEGFQRQLKFLLNEKSLLDIQVYHAGAIKNITVNGARIVMPSGEDIPFSSENFKQRANFAIYRTIQELQTKPAGL